MKYKNLYELAMKRKLPKKINLRDNPEAIRLISLLRNMFNVDFKLAEINRHGTMHFVSEDKQIAILYGSYSTVIYFRGYYGYTSRIFTYFNENEQKQAVETYIQFKTDPNYIKNCLTNYDQINFLLW